MKEAAVVTAAVVLAATGLAPAAELKGSLRIGPEQQRQLRLHFGSYGFDPPRSIFSEAEGLRLWLPADVAEVKQTGLYSTFALAGDCEVTLTYELLVLTPPRDGYGSGIGLALDAGDDVGRATIQRVCKPAEGHGHVVQTTLALPRRDAAEEYRFLPASHDRGRIGLRRVKKDLIFLAADDTFVEPKEIERLPFTDRTIRSVRVFVDTGGSATAVDVRVLEFTAKAEEVSGGQVHTVRGVPANWWPWVVVPTGAGVLAAGFWWIQRRRT